MGKCICNSKKDSRFICMKDNVYLCEECLKCRNPEIYCKYRTACPIWFMEKKGSRWEIEGESKESDETDNDLLAETDSIESQ